MKPIIILSILGILLLASTRQSYVAKSSIELPADEREIIPEENIAPYVTLGLVVPAKADPEAVAYSILIAKEYHIRIDTFLCVLNQESGINGRKPDGTLKCGDSGASCGLGQIQYPTWKSIRKHAGWDLKDLRDNTIENIKTTAYGLTHGWREHWSGFRYCHSKLGMDL